MAIKQKYEDGTRRKRKIDISCQFCKVFHDIPVGDRDVKAALRYCPAVKKDVNFADQSCAHFEPSQFFWCSKLSFFSSADICIDRMEKSRIQECHKCNDGLQIYSFYNPPQIVYSISE